MSALLQTNGTAAAAAKANASTNAWLQSSVREFFTGFNWDDHPPEVQEIREQAVQTGATELSMTLTVRQFFTAIPWDGAIAEPLPIEDSLEELLGASSPANDFTLDDFSDFF